MASAHERFENHDDLIHSLFVAEYASMCRTAYYILGDYDLAETAVQETFVVALRFREKLSASEKPVGWLYKALRFTIKHIQRDRQILIQHTVSLEDAPELETAYSGEYAIFDDEIIRSDEMRLLVDFYYRGYSVKEIADHLGISTGACKMRIKRAKEHIREKLK